MTIKNQFPFEIFVFGESIPALVGYDGSFLAALSQIYLLFFEKFGLQDDVLGGNR